MKKCLSLKNSKGAWLVLGISVALVLIFSAVAGLFITQNNRVMVKKITLDTRGAGLSIEQYEPRNVSSDDSLPCVILFHGGSESLSAAFFMPFLGLSTALNHQKQCFRCTYLPKLSGQVLHPAWCWG